ncbi:MAG: hypothetical protein Kow00124_15040 [Anaerolineae bacterium]
MTLKEPFAHRDRALQSPHPRAAAGRPAAGSGLPTVFQFSQQSLQDYVECERRFQLRYVMGQRWPAVVSEPVEEYERLMTLGAQFHLLVQRHLLGIPAELLTPADPNLARWWRAYLEAPPPDLPQQVKQPEVLLSTPVGRHRVLAKYDLLAIDPGQRIVIVDWKTTHHRPSRQRLEERLQSRMYPFVLVEAGEHLFGGAIAPEQVTMIYWFAEEPTRPEIFPYSAEQHQENQVYLSALIAQITDLDPAGIWPLTDDHVQCRYCVYRSLCDRGERAGSLADADDVDEFTFDFDFDLDQIDEIAF